MSIKKLACFILTLFIATGCSRQKKIKLKNNVQQQEEIIAKFADLPDTPFQAQLKDIAVPQESCNQLQLFYVVAMPQNELLVFYQQQMERLGWELLGESTTRDYLMHYGKPGRVCSILISQNNLSIYVCNKQGA